MWFTENPWPPMLICFVIAIVFLLVWNSSRRNLYFLLAVTLLLLCGVFYVAERSIVTEGERLQERVVHLCEDFQHKDLEKVLNYVSPTQPKLRDLFTEGMNLVTIQRDLRLNDFRTTFSKNNTIAKVHFRANAFITVSGEVGVSGNYPARLILTFERENGEWKIIDVERLSPFNGQKMGSVLERSPG